MRSFFLLCCVLMTASLSADALASRLRLLLPGEAAATVNERQYLYQRISTLFRDMDAEKIGRKSVKKKIKKVAAYLEDNHFRTYDGTADLSDAFRRGRYNDATAAVLTALALEHFELDYYAVVDHWEAYLLVDPAGKRAVIRSPRTRKRRDEEEAAFRADYLQLVRATLAEGLELRNQEEIDAAFTKYFYAPEKVLSFGQLSAYAMYRRAQAAYAREDYASAIRQTRAASARENRPAFLALRRAAEIQLTALEPTAETGDIGESYRLWTEDPDNKYLPAAILNHFDVEQQLLLAQNRPDLARKLLDDYASKAPAGSAAWEQELIRLQRFRLVNYYYNEGRLDLAKAAAESLYADEPDNETIRYILGEIVIGNLRRTSARGESFDREVEAAADRYPFIRKQDRFADLLLRELAWKVRDLYAEDQLAAATSALARFRTALIDIPIGRERSLWTLTAFYAASDYYFRQDDFGRARTFIEEALRYSSDDQFLLHQLDLLGRY